MKPPTLFEVQQWPAIVNVTKAAAAFGVSRAHAYACIAAGTFPAQTLKVGGRLCVITASIVRVLSKEAA